MNKKRLQRERQRHLNELYLKRKDDILRQNIKATVCLGSNDPFHIVAYYIKWVTTFWTHSKRYGKKNNKYLYIITPLSVQIYIPV